jgi:hypothetical protein
MFSYDVLGAGERERWMFIVVMGLLLAVSSAVSLRAQDHLAIRIDTLNEVYLNSSYDVGVRLEGNSMASSLSGFSLLIGYDGTAMQVDSVLQGSALVACDWEYFTYRTSVDDYCPYPPCPERPAGLLRIVALAETNNGSPHPSCFLEGPGELARLRITTSALPDRLCNLAPVRFYWQDCGDNVVTLDPGNDSLLLSDRVYEFGNRIDDPSMALPGFFGAPGECVRSDSVTGSVAMRGIDFYNGHIQFACQDSATNHSTIAIGQTRNVASGQVVQLPVMLYPYESSIQSSGFDVLLSYDANGLTLEGVTVGSALQICGWEYFNYRSEIDSNCSAPPCTRSLLRIVALADLGSNSVHPSCLLNSDGELARMSFRVNQGGDLLCRKLPVSFWWSDCADNTVASRMADTQFVSRRVFDCWGQAITADTTLPSLGGAVSACLSAGPQTIVRKIDYVNGFIQVECYDQIDARGDLNLNGLANEIADMVYYANYFLYGLQAFSINRPMQVAASDVNADGLPLRVADYEYLCRIISGDALPYPKLPVDSTETAIFTQDSVAQTVSFEYPPSLGAIHLVFDGIIQPLDTIVGGLGIAAVSDSGFTKVLIAPWFVGGEPFLGIHYLTFGVLFHYSGAGELVYADATFDGTQIVPTAIQGSSGMCCRHRGNVEGWDDLSGTVDIADLTSLVTYLFLPPYTVTPGCFGEADANDDSRIDVADVSALVDYLFEGQLLPICH